MTPRNRAVSRLLSAFVFLCGALRLSYADVPAWKEVYNPFVVRSLHLELLDADWNRVRFDQPMEGETESQERAEAWFHGEGETPIRVEIRRKGQTDPALPSDADPQKVSVKIDFNAVVPGQKWHGLRKISLENGGDAGPLDEGFAWQVHRIASDAGYYRYDAANSAWVKLYINGHYKGVFVSTEQRDEQLLRNRDLYSEANTWLYKVDGQTYLELGAGNSPARTHLNFAPFGNGTQPDLAIDLPQWIDMESMLTLAACEAYVENNDGLVTHSGKNSFAADFNPPNIRRRIYFPWDMDSSIKQGRSPIYGNEPYQLQILNNPWFGRVYEHIFREMLAGPLSDSSLHAFLNQLEPILGPALDSDPYAAPDGGAASAFTSLRSWVTRRNADIATRYIKPYVARPSFSHPGGEVVSGTPLTITAPAGQIYYTTNGTDPRALNGSIAGGAVLYSAPIVIDQGMKVVARAISATNWSGLATEAAFQIATYTTPLRITEIMYHPSDPNPADALDADAYEFLELHNTSASSIDLTGYFFDGISFSFPPGSTLAAGARLVLVRNASAFSAQYSGVAVGGVYLGGLNNDGEKIRLKRPDGTTVISVEYDDDPPWVISPDGLGYSLVNRNPDGNPDEATNWRASRDPGGSPAGPDPEPAYAVDVAINEVLANTAPPYEDAVEIRNSAASEADIGNWYLSNEAQDALGTLVPNLLKKYRLPTGTTVPANGLVALYEEAFQAANPLVPFSLSSHGGRVYLSSADAAGNLTGHIVALEYPATDLNTAYGIASASDGVRDVPLSTPTFGVNSPADVAAFRAGTGAPNAAPRVPSIVISEIMYHPLTPSSEFVELHNVSAAAVDISAWDVDGIAGFAFPAGTSIPAGGFLVLLDTTATTVAAFRAAFNVPPEAQVFGHFFDLANDGESLRLEKPNPTAGQPNILVEKVRFNDKAPWPTEADGVGPSLERLPPAQPGFEPLHWKAVTMHGTPGRLGTAPAGLAVKKGSFWEYKVSAASLGTIWKDVAYNASGWESVDGSAGYGEPFLAGVISYGPNAFAKYPTTYFRKRFAIQDTPTAIASLRLSTLHDDGVVVYLNGTEVARLGMPDGSIDYTTLAAVDREATVHEELDLTAHKNLLVQGTNVIAVEVHQSAPDSPDLVWDAELTYTLVSAPVDFDGDGLPSDWEAAHGFSDSDAADALLDSDGDSQNNRFEYAAATDPRDPSSVFRIQAAESAPGGGVLIRWSSVPGKTYRIRYSPDLQFWFGFGLAGDITATGAVTSFTESVSPLPAKRFYQVIIPTAP